MRSGYMIAVVVSGLMSAAAFSAGCGGERQAYVEINGRRWDVELAVTRDQQYLGMAGREEAPAGTGMLFVFRESEPHEFVMRGCLVPLDIAFIDADRRIVAIHTMEVEPDLVGRKRYPSGEPAKYALEVAGGALAEAGVKVGDEVKFSRGID